MHPEKLTRQTLEILPAPFAWLPISGGTVQIEDTSDRSIGPGSVGGVFTVGDFLIGKYPVTVAQYAVFIEDGGYQNPDYWTESGWNYGVNLATGWDPPGFSLTAPQEWEPPSAANAHHPVTGLSWIEAYAFTQWLSAKLGVAVSLPTEQQWQRAAEGDAKFTYPWGNAWDATRCNNLVGLTPVESLEQFQLTPVNQFEPDGNSPFGVVDMAGNTWEFCLTDYVNDDNSEPEYLSDNTLRALRGCHGGLGDANQYRVQHRHMSHPIGQSTYNGFRVALSDN